MQIKLSKMKAALEDQVQYTLKGEAENIDMNQLLGQKIKMTYLQKQQCASCAKEKKLFAQGFCYDCFTKAPEAAPCIINPELCEGHLGKGRDVEWEKAHHVQPHVVYLAVASALKVGVTRETQVPTRWIDQGASFAIKLAEVPYRKLAGDIEVALKGTFTDKTNWRAMLKNEIGDFDLEEEKWQCEELLPNDLSEYMSEDDDIFEINYPVLQFPEKVKSIGFDKQLIIEGQLLGIKGQYLLLDDNRVLNIRKHTGYYVDFEV
jgi:hypothetical protein